MATRILGPTGSKKRRRFLIVPILLIAGLALFWIGSASPSVHDVAVFQLDGNATVADTGPLGYPGDDWDNICTTAAPNVKTGCNPGTGDTTHRVGSAFDYDQHLAGPAGSGIASCPKTNPTVYAPGNNCTTFTGGGSKDDGDINGWAWNDGSGGLPDKDNLEQGYSARYTYSTTLTAAVPAATPCNPTTPTTIQVDNTVASWFSATQQSFQATNHKDYHLTIGNETMLVTGGQDTNTLNVLRCQQGSTDGAHAIGDTVTVSLLYFGGTRFDNSGDAQIGIWFFQNNVALGTNKIGGGTGFSGVHKNGDILVLSTFTGGGETPTIQVWKWVAGQGNNGNTNLQLLSPQAGASCIPVAGTSIVEVATTSPFCAAVNPADGTPSPWTFTNKRGRTTFDAAEFYEGGLNISAFPQLASECFGSFEIETRSSQSTDAVLKDFLLGPLQSCQASVTTDHSITGTVHTGDTVHDSATVTGSGPAPKGSVDFYTCVGTDATVATALCTTQTPPVSATNGTFLSTSSLAANTVNPVTVQSGDFSVPTTAAGKYVCFLAIYKPGTDPNYGPSPDKNASSSGETNESTRECFFVTPTTTTTTRQFVFPQDKAKIVAQAGSGNLSGNVAFIAYDSALDCANDTNPRFTSSTNAITGASPQFATTNNTSYRVASDATVYWRVTYTSSNSQEGSSSVCSEQTAIAFTGNDSSIDIP
jgi:hypothetical protein